MISAYSALAGFLIVYLTQMAAELGLEWLNLQHLRRGGAQVPPSFEGFIDASRLQRISAYTIEKNSLSISSNLACDLLTLFLILSGFMPALDGFLLDLHLSYMLAGLLFFLAPAFILYAARLPFDFYLTFHTEDKFGFNRSTLRLWLLDHLKSGLISTLLSSLVLIMILWTIRIWPDHWWLGGFIIVSVVQIALAMLYPALIAPLFNQFTPISDELLAEKILQFMREQGIVVRKIFQMDAGKRSRHTNAYLSGLGKTKQIVLFDTLLESHPHQEVLAVLAHEVGHFKKKHIIKLLLGFEVSMFLAFYLTDRLLDWAPLYSAFGFEILKPYVGLFFIALFWQKIGFFVKPLYMALSRHFEREADLFAAGLLRNFEVVATVFKRMASDNLSNLNPHPLYVWFNYSHPPLAERIACVQKATHSDKPTGVIQESR